MNPVQLWQHNPELVVTLSIHSPQTSKPPSGSHPQEVVMVLGVLSCTFGNLTTSCKARGNCANQNFQRFLGLPNLPTCSQVSTVLDFIIHTADTIIQNHFGANSPARISVTAPGAVI